jgi:tetratricopeptide (TPR) repeat protein
MVPARILAFCLVGFAAIGCRGERDDPDLNDPNQMAVEQGVPAGKDRSVSSRPQIQDIRNLLARGQAAEAEASLRRLLVGNPNDREVQTLVGDVLEMQKRYDEAATWALKMSAADPTSDASRAWLEKAYFWSLEAADWATSENAARLAVERFPDQPAGHRHLAWLLSSQGRRQEASRSIHRLLKLGAADSREILSLVDISGPFQVVSFDRYTDRITEPGKLGLFALGKARDSYIGDNDPDEALRLLQTVRKRHPDEPSVEAFYGRVLAETNRNDAFIRWLSQAPDGVAGESEYWLAIGTWLQRTDRDRESIGALARAVEINPTDRTAMRLLAAGLTRTGQDERAAGVQAALSKLDSVFRKAALADATDAFQIGSTLESLVRPWEALGWYGVAIERGAGGTAERQRLAERSEAIRRWEGQATKDRIVTARTRKLLGFDPADYPLPERWGDVAGQPARSVSAQRSALVFRDVAPSAGIRTTFISDYNLNEVDFFLHQANGGGLGIIDYDRDGRGDVYVVQSGGDPNAVSDSAPNELYRQTESLAFSPVQTDAGCDGRGYGQGVCGADVNQDGFVDLLIANIGRNQLLINQGDGTFRDATATHFPPSRAWTSSLGAGDLDGDQLPDLVEVNYVDDPQVFQKKCRGEIIACVPQDFRAARDRFFKASGDGRFVNNELIVHGDVEPSYGFGVVIADFDGQGGNEVFVSNDGLPNHYWRPGPLDPVGALVESAGICGNAVGASGIAEACMGVGAGDFDHDGRLDLAVANFYKEPLNLFLQSRPGAFVDEAMRRGLDVPSRGVLGFGCQAADFDNDGWLDLGVLNGHLYDYRHGGIPFQMRPQLFRGSEGSFELQAVTEGASFFASERLGRTLATGDLDRDGRIDLLANFLDAPVALLMNESESANWLQIELVGRRSERDAVGAVVQVRCDGETVFGWGTGGDGYMCTNESILHFGLGGHLSVDRLTIRWPSGESETLANLPINRRLLIVEGLGAW